MEKLKTALLMGALVMIFMFVGNAVGGRSGMMIAF